MRGFVPNKEIRWGHWNLIAISAQITFLRVSFTYPIVNNSNCRILQLANDNPWPNPTCLQIFVNKVLLEHATPTLSMSAFVLRQQS